MFTKKDPWDQYLRKKGEEKRPGQRQVKLQWQLHKKSSGLKMTHQVCCAMGQNGWPFIPPPLSLAVGLPKGVTRGKAAFCSRGNPAGAVIWLHSVKPKEKNPSSKGDLDSALLYLPHSSVLQTYFLEISFIYRSPCSITDILYASNVHENALPRSISAHIVSNNLFII